MRELWPLFKGDSEFSSYFPEFDEDRTPPRLYFFQILSVLRPQKYMSLINESKQARQKVAEQQNKIISVDGVIWSTLTNARLYENLVTTSESKRILLTKKSGHK